MLASATTSSMAIHARLNPVMSSRVWHACPLGLFMCSLAGSLCRSHVHRALPAALPFCTALAAIVYETLPQTDTNTLSTTTAKFASVFGHCRPAAAVVAALQTIRFVCTSLVFCPVSRCLSSHCLLQTVSPAFADTTDSLIHAIVSLAWRRPRGNVLTGDHATLTGTHTAYIQNTKLFITDFPLLDLFWD